MFDLSRFHLRTLANALLPRLRLMLLGLVVLSLSMTVLAVAAVACEGGGGPPTAPTKPEQYATNPPGAYMPWCFLGKSVNCATGNETEEQAKYTIFRTDPIHRGWLLLRIQRGRPPAQDPASGSVLSAGTNLGKAALFIPPTVSDL